MDLIKTVTVKLGVENEKGVILFRRVDLSRYVDKNVVGGRCYKILKLLAIQSATGLHDVPSEDSFKDFRVTLHYTDTEGDEVMIGSSSELKYALELYRSKKVIKIIADVSSIVDDVASRASTSTQTTHVATEDSKEVNSKSSTASDAAVQTFVESLGPAMLNVEGSVRKVADTVIAAAEALEAEATAPPSVGESPGSQTVFVRNFLKNIFPVLMKEEVRAAADRIRTVAETVRTNASNTNGVTTEVNEASDTKNEKADEDKAFPTSEASGEKSDLPVELDAPSVQPEAKIPNNIEVSIQESPVSTSKVAPAQLKSPPVQVEDKIPNNIDVSSPIAEQPPKSETKAEPTVTIPATGRPFIHGRHTCDGCLTTPIVGKRYHAVDLPDYDLCENCVKNYSGVKVNFEPVELERDAVFQDRWHRRRARWGAHGHPHARGCRHPVGHHHGGPRRWQQHPHNHQGCFSPAAEPQVPTSDQVDAALKEAIRRSLIDFKKAEDNEIVSGSSESDKVAPDSEAVDNQLVVEATEKTADMSNLNNEHLTTPEPVVNEEKINKDLNEEVIATAGLNVTKSDSDEADIVVPCSKSEEPEIIVESTLEQSTTDTMSKRTSFGTEAEGFGDIAVVLGEALDKVALGIDELNTELDRSSLNKDASAVEPITITEASNGKDNDDASDDLSEGSWNVVADEQIGDNEALARAAHVIGSALFNSDMAHSHGEVSMMSHSQVTSPSASSSGTSCSSVESVPTILPSIASTKQPSVASAMQHECWAPQLEHLHELGFLNDNLLIETIERLNAANIGVDSTDEVTVQQIIEELMKDW